MRKSDERSHRCAIDETGRRRNPALRDWSVGDIF
jgi:hypothetical protein